MIRDYEYPRIIETTMGGVRLNMIYTYHNIEPYLRNSYENKDSKPIRSMYSPVLLKGNDSDRKDVDQQK